MIGNLVVPLLSLILGVLLGGVVNATVSRYAAFKESKGMAAALRAEILALVELASRRNYLESLNAIIGRLEQPDYQPTLVDIFGFRATRDFFVVFHSTCSKIGALAEIAPAVVRIYVVAKALLEDTTALEEMRTVLLKERAVLYRQPVLSASLAMRELLEIVLQEGPRVADRLGEYAERKWFGLVP